ncbi:MAG: acetate--CoA ligase family protein [Firmicutes bacterium]|nr:acetate--CoA ligase family protein [Bacillota bacterium]
MKDLGKLFRPSGVALIGASDKPGSVGNELWKRITEYGYKDDLYPVNPRMDKLDGKKVYKSISETGKVDLAIIAVPAAAVAGVLEECGKRKIGAAAIISAGFKETGNAGLKLEQEIKAIADKYNIAMLGPNCLGVINTDPDIMLNGTFAPLQPKRGGIGFATQSGALASGIINIMPTMDVGLAQMVSLGNQAQISATELINHWGDEKQVEQILLYIESILEPETFRETASRVSKTKPIIAIKSGRSESGAKAAASHTGALAGSDKAAGALLGQCGVIREDNLGDMFTTALCFSKCCLPAGRRVGIVTNAGGVGILASDELVKNGFTLAELSSKTKKALRDVLAPQASVNNPVDVIASASAEQYKLATYAVLKDENVDTLFCIYLYITERNDTAILQDLNNKKQMFPNKTIVAVFMTAPDFEGSADVPVFKYAEEAVHGLRRLAERAEYLVTSETQTKTYKVDKFTAANVLNKVKNERRAPTTFESMEVFKAYGIKLADYVLTKNVKEAVAAANKIGYPVVIKLDSKTISHKTDVGGVVVNINNNTDLNHECSAMLERVEAADMAGGFNGIIVMKQIKGSRELVAGINRDPSFGPMLMFGIGGVFIEALEEVNFKLLPVTQGDICALLASGKASKLLGAIRGSKPANKKELSEMLLRLSQLVTDFPEIEELDANPIMLDKNGEAWCVDARIGFANK